MDLRFALAPEEPHVYSPDNFRDLRSPVGATCRPYGARFQLAAYDYKHCVPTGLKSQSCVCNHT